MVSRKTESRKEMDIFKYHHIHQLYLVRLEDALCSGIESQKHILSGQTLPALSTCSHLYLFCTVHLRCALGRQNKQQLIILLTLFKLTSLLDVNKMWGLTVLKVMIAFSSML